MGYRWCVVPLCTNTSTKTPDKMFVPVPINPKRRKTWLTLARRDFESISPNSMVFMCQDHFDIEKDISNYMKYKMGFSTRLIVADGAMPLKFHCQRKTLLSFTGTYKQAKLLMRKGKYLVKECNEDSVIATSVQKNVSYMQKTIKLEPEELSDKENQMHEGYIIETEHSSYDNYTQKTIKLEIEPEELSDKENQLHEEYIIETDDFSYDNYTQKSIKLEKEPEELLDKENQLHKQYIIETSDYNMTITCRKL